MDAQSIMSNETFHKVIVYSILAAMTFQVDTENKQSSSALRQSTYKHTCIYHARLTSFYRGLQLRFTLMAIRLLLDSPSRGVPFPIT
jgi:hypothetical protein